MKTKIMKLVLAVIMVVCLSAAVLVACNEKHVCQHVCPECGKCLSDCDNEVCKDKCKGHDNPKPDPKPDPKPSENDKVIPEGATLGACTCENGTVWKPEEVAVRIIPTENDAGIVGSVCKKCGYSAYYWDIPAFKDGGYTKNVVTEAGESTFGSAEYAIEVNGQTFTFTSALYPTGKTYTHREECESMDLVGCRISSEAGANNPSNGAYAGGMSWSAGRSVSYTFAANTRGQALLYIGWANSYDSYIGKGEKQLRLTVNGVDLEPGTKFIANYDKDLRYFEWTRYEICVIDIVDDINTITLTNVDGAPASNLDYFDLISTVEILPKNQAHVCSEQCPQCGLCLNPDCTKKACANKCQGHENTKHDGWWTEAAMEVPDDFIPQSVTLQPDALYNAAVEALVDDNNGKGLDLAKTPVGTKIGYYLTATSDLDAIFKLYFTPKTALAEGGTYNLAEYVKITVGGTEITSYAHSANWTGSGYVALGDATKQYKLAVGQELAVVIEVLKSDDDAPVFNEFTFSKYVYGHTFMWSDTQLELGGMSKVNAKEECVGMQFNKQNSITIKFYSNKAVKGVKLYITTSSNTDTHSINDAYGMTLNGVAVDSQNNMPIGKRYFDYTESFVAEVDLVEGLNTIVINADWTGDKGKNTWVYNFRQLALRDIATDVEITYAETTENA